MDLTTIGGRVWAIRSDLGLSRRAFAERLGCQEMEIKNIEFNKLKKPEQKESLYRNIATTFGVSLDWIKTGEGDMYGSDQRDEASSAFGALAALHDPTIDSFIEFLRKCTPEQLALIAQQLQSIMGLFESFQNKTED